MQADEIIQNQEWSNLTEDEKSCISELALNEREFYLLKQMMNMSAAEAFDVPEVSLSVKENILGEIRKKPTFKIQRYWYLAAAAIIAFGFLTFLLFQSKPKSEIVKDTKLPELPFQKVPEIVAPVINKNEEIVKDEIKGNQTHEEIIPKQKRHFKINTPVGEQSLATNNSEHRNDDLSNLDIDIKQSESAKVSSGIVSKKMASNSFMKERALASNNSVNKNRDFLNLITEIF